MFCVARKKSHGGRRSSSPRYKITGRSGGDKYDFFGYKDTCQGDSGGPIWASDPETGVSTVVGVVSRGAGCGGRDLPGIATRIKEEVEWIRSMLGGWDAKVDNGEQDKVDSVVVFVCNFAVVLFYYYKFINIEFVAVVVVVVAAAAVVVVVIAESSAKKIYNNRDINSEQHKHFLQIHHFQSSDEGLVKHSVISPDHGEGHHVWSSGGDKTKSSSTTRSTIT